jgi:hypothetical protein
MAFVSLGSNVDILRLLESGVPSSALFGIWNATTVFGGLVCEPMMTHPSGTVAETVSSRVLMSAPRPVVAQRANKSMYVFVFIITR